MIGFIFGIGTQDILSIIAERGYIWPYVPLNSKFNMILLIPMLILIIEMQAGQFFKNYDNIILFGLSYLIMFILLDFNGKGVKND